MEPCSCFEISTAGFGRHCRVGAMLHCPWVGWTTAIRVATLPACGCTPVFGLVGRVTTGHLHQGALVTVVTKAPLERGGLVVVVGAQAATTPPSNGRGGGGRRGNNEMRWCVISLSRVVSPVARGRLAGAVLGTLMTAGRGRRGTQRLRTNVACSRLLSRKWDGDTRCPSCHKANGLCPPAPGRQRASQVNRNPPPLATASEPITPRTDQWLSQRLTTLDGRFELRWTRYAFALKRGVR